MGLPSGVQWANCNVGAARPSELGIYFSWGNTEGHMIDEGYDFSLDVYNSTQGANIATNLSLEQDAARTNLGEPWRMPTAADFQELYDNCTYVWTTMNGVNGMLFTSNINGNTLFFPAAGLFEDETLIYRSGNGYWSSSWISEADARNFRFSSVQAYPNGSASRHFGCPVRGVLDTV